MPDVIAERISRYVLDGSDDDLRRLLRISEFLAEPTRAAITRTGIRPGWSAIECGCGPLGALGILADLVGPEGRVVGIDFHEATVARCRSVLDMLGVGYGDVMVADVHGLDPKEAGAPFDLAYCRCFLMHQANPAETLSAVSRLVRPGGWIVVQEPLRFPPPVSHPRVPAQERYWELMYLAMEASGIPSYSVETLPGSAETAGLEVVHIGGFNRPALDAASSLELHLLTLVASRARIVGSGVASETEVEALLAEMRAAMAEDLQWSASPFFLDLVMRTGT
ncbi:MAG: class I SAM-dependent methyltransferase [Mycobacterium sp.]|nr:class I SAM-dependent methyltransferase [Mycobacterium sp.]